MRYLRQNTAVKITVGPFLDYEDGVTHVSVTPSNSTCTITRDHDDDSGVTTVKEGALTASGGDNDLVSIANGLYSLELTAAQTNYLGRYFIHISDPDFHCPVFHEFMILPANVYDSMFLGTDNLQVDTVQVGGTTQTANDNGADINAILADTNELQGDLTNGGRLDLILDELTSQGDTNEDKLDTIDGIVDDILIHTGTTLSAAISGVDDNVSANGAAITSVAGYVSSISAQTTQIEGRLTAARAGYIDKLNVAGTLANTNNAASFMANITSLATGEDLAQAAGNITTLINRLTAARAGYLDKLNVSGDLANTDNASSFMASGFSTHSAADVITALKASTGWTQGSSKTYAQIIKLFAAFMIGSWRDKSGSPGTIEILDPDDSSVLMELTPSTSTPYKQVTTL